MQESKNIRTNKCINYFARRSGVSIGIMAMNYAGNVGKSFHLKSVDNATIAVPIGAPKLPIIRQQIQDGMMEDTMINLFKLKAHLVKMDEELKTGTETTIPIIIPQVFTTPPIKPSSPASSLSPPTPLDLNA